MSEIGRQREYQIDRWMVSVTRILALSSGKAPHPCGVGKATGFFYEKDGQKYLITNRHVILEESREEGGEELGFYPDSLRIRVHISGGSWENRYITIPLYYDNREPKWLEHPNNSNLPPSDKIDVVAINIDSYVSSSDIITYWSRNYFLPDDEMLGIGQQTLIVGYPMGFYDRIQNFPITKSGTLASPYPIYFERKPFFLIDANLSSGMSGSPVILPTRSLRTLKTRTTAIQTPPFPASLLGIFSGEYSSNGIRLGLNQVWYPTLIEQILSR